jgi:hypothetical protein
MNPFKLPVLTLVVLRVILTALDAIATQLAAAFAAVPTGSKATLSWGTQMPQLAAAFANMLDLGQGLFSWVTFTSQDLRNLNDTIEVLREISTLLNSLSTQVGNVLALYRNQLFTVMNDQVSGLQNVIACPATDPTLREKLIKLSQIVNSIVAARNAAISQTKKNNKKKAQAHNGQVSSLQQENSVLRGNSLPAPTAAKSKRSKRSAPR